MRKILFPSFLMTLIACGNLISPPEERLNGEEHDRLTESRRAWDSLKLEHADTYSYQRLFSSWVGYQFTNVFHIQDGQVVYRSYAYYDENTQGDAPSESWTEEGDEVGDHIAGYPAKTLDALYDECESNVLGLDPEGYEVALVFDNAEILQSCTYLEYGCTGGCGGGPVIHALVMGPWEE